MGRGKVWVRDVDLGVELGVLVTVPEGSGVGKGCDGVDDACGEGNAAGVLVGRLDRCWEFTPVLAYLALIVQVMRAISTGLSGSVRLLEPEAIAVVLSSPVSLAGVEVNSLAGILFIILSWTMASCSSGEPGASAVKGLGELDDAVGRYPTVGAMAMVLDRSWETSTALAHTAIAV